MGVCIATQIYSMIKAIENCWWRQILLFFDYEIVLIVSCLSFPRFLPLSTHNLSFPPPFFRYSLDLWGQPRDIDYTPRWRNGPFRYSHNRSPKHKLVLLWRKCGHSQRWEKIGCKIAERNNEWKAPTHKHGKMARFNEKQVKFRSLWNEVFF